MTVGYLGCLMLGCVILGYLSRGRAPDGVQDKVWRKWQRWAGRRWRWG